MANRDFTKLRIQKLKTESNKQKNNGHLYSRKKPEEKNVAVVQEQLVAEKAPVVEIPETHQEIIDNIDKLVKEYQLTDKNDDRISLNEYLEKQNLEFADDKYVPASETKRKIARMHFDGFIKKPMAKDASRMSDTYKEILSDPLGRKEVKPEDYNMAESSVWKVFQQVPEFAAIEDKFRKALALSRIPQSALPYLNVIDFSDILYKKYCDPRNRDGSVRIFEGVKRNGENFLGMKKLNTKTFIEKNGAEFEAQLMQTEGIDKQYVKDLIEEMRTRGNTDLSYKIAKGLYRGKTPVFNVHHVTNIKDLGQLEAEGKKFYEVNDVSNMLFVEIETHDALHLTDKPQYIETVLENGVRKKIIKSIQRIRPKKGVCAMIGFGKQNCVYGQELESNTKNVSCTYEKNSNNGQKSYFRGNSK